MCNSYVNDAPIHSNKLQFFKHCSSVLCQLHKRIDVILRRKHLNLHKRLLNRFPFSRSGKSRRILAFNNLTTYTVHFIHNARGSSFQTQIILPLQPLIALQVPGSNFKAASLSCSFSSASLNSGNWSASTGNMTRPDPDVLGTLGRSRAGRHPKGDASHII